MPSALGSGASSAYALPTVVPPPIQGHGSGSGSSDAIASAVVVPPPPVVSGSGVADAASDASAAGVVAPTPSGVVVLRWTLHDPVADETWTMPINPDAASPIGSKGRVLTFAGGGPGGDLRTRVMSGPRVRDWSWSGVIRTEAHYAELSRWAKKRNAITVTDHLGRTVTVYLTKFDPTDRRPTALTPWRLRYTMTAKIIAGP